MYVNGTRKLLWVDLPALARASVGSSDSSELPPLLDATIEDGVDVQRGTYPKPKRIADIEQFYVMPQTHLMYAATWYSLAAFATVITYNRFKGGKAGSAGKKIAALRQQQQAQMHAAAAPAALHKSSGAPPH